MDLLSDNQLCAKARCSRDPRFDGLFFTAVVSTGIYCRPICPANSPREENVRYYASAAQAAAQGFRPCLRCRPDSAPNSYAWLGSKTTFERALGLINQGALQEQNLQQLATRLGVTDRYLRKLFATHLGLSPKKYAIYQQCLFAKRLLHETRLPIAEVAFAAGFDSVRRFNEAIQQQLALTPSQIRKADKSASTSVELKLAYRPPFNWDHLLKFYQTRSIPGIEWVDESVYGRSIEYKASSGWLALSHDPQQHCLRLRIELDNYQHLSQIVQRARLVFDTDCPIQTIDDQLAPLVPGTYLPGLRVPGIWGFFEAGVRAILGQQVTVRQARQLTTQCVAELGRPLCVSLKPVTQTLRLFPRPEDFIRSDLGFLKMPGARKAALKNLAEYVIQAQDRSDLQAWHNIKGIGPWTVNYVKLRAAKEPDIWMANDTGIRNALARLTNHSIIDAARPWRSYLTFQLWNQS